MFKSKMKSLKEDKWKNKALNGQYSKILEKPHVDSVTTNKWLSSNLKGETEGLLVAAQDQDHHIQFNSIQKHLFKHDKKKIAANC